LLTLVGFYIVFVGLPQNWRSDWAGSVSETTLLLATGADGNGHAEISSATKQVYSDLNRLPAYGPFVCMCVCVRVDGEGKREQTDLKIGGGGPWREMGRGGQGLRIEQRGGTGKIRRKSR
jgi:hypothetical protein